MKVRRGISGILRIQIMSVIMTNLLWSVRLYAPSKWLSVGRAATRPRWVCVCGLPVNKAMWGNKKVSLLCHCVLWLSCEVSCANRWLSVCSCEVFVPCVWQFKHEFKNVRFMRSRPDLLLPVYRPNAFLVPFFISRGGWFHVFCVSKYVRVSMPLGY